MHTKRLGVVEKYGTHDCTGFRQEWKDARLDLVYEAMLPQSKPTIGSMMVLASYTGPTWNLIARVFSGDVEETIQKTKNSNHQRARRTLTPCPTFQKAS
jgi:hypothetical protein